MAKWVIITLFFTAHEFVCWGQDKVEQASRQMTANEAAQVTLLCNYSTTTNVYLFWYKQLSNKSPTLILNKYPFSEGITDPDFKKRFSATLDTTSKTVPLMIKNLHSALYYCALRLYNIFFTLISNHIKPTIYNSHNIIILVETPGLLQLVFAYVTVLQQLYLKQESTVDFNKFVLSK
uniref:Immunoglobulin V-set domain-containing protein n=1 Tax=Sinocyclocheilus grahami TaxID=75366 RepID=A0A672PCI9_SINGR